MSGAARSSWPAVLADASRLGCTVFEAVGLITLCGLYLLASGSGDTAVVSAANLVGAACYCALLAVGGWRALRLSAYAIWTPMFWFRFTAAAFYGFGAMAPFLAPDQTAAYALSFYSFSEEELLRVNLLNAASTLILLLGVRLFARLVPPRCGGRGAEGVRRNGAGLPHVDLQLCAMLFLGVGLFVRYFLDLPHQFGMLGFVLPGIIMQLKNFVYVGLFVAFVLVFRGNQSWAAIAWPLLLVETFVSLLTFGKQDTLVNLLMPLLAAFTVSHSRRVLAVGLLGLFAVYVAIKPVTDFGRVELSRVKGNISQATLGERLDILGRFSVEETQANTAVYLPMAWFARLSYAGPQAFALSLRDRGVEGNSLERATIALIPRPLWPDKPEVTGLGKEITYLAQGFDTSSTGISIFAEAYWNSGALGVVTWSIWAAIVYLFYSAYALRTMRQQTFWFLPVVLLGILGGHSGDFVPTFIGGAAQAVVIHFALVFGALMLSALRIGGVSRTA